MDYKHVQVKMGAKKGINVAKKVTLLHGLKQFLKQLKHERKQSTKNGSASILKHLDKRDVCNA